ncbi:uncharacterized protein RAG0_05628 [Rhynchosporium agropyri]|uniref:Uncharacterized protein n=1 Tax=Rhynchosporium agropyri TaxID=914238 RepID=A0A1E1KDZ3_9HELO|nr:uncharacterized protein RAG0_05628 [Rhynchosporium agropyri]
MNSLLLTTLLLTSVVHAADVGTYSYTTSPAFTATQISQFNSTANSSSSYKVDSIIYDSPFNLTSLHPIYTLTLAISEPTIQDTQTRSLIFITPPTGKELGIKNGTDILSWDTCAIIFRRVTDAATKRGENEDGGCNPTLGKECIDAIFAHVQEKTTPQERFQGCGKLVTEIPLECSDAIAGSISDVLTVDLNPRSGNNAAASLPLLHTASETHALSNTSYIDEFSHRIWPVLMYQSAASTGEQGVKSAATKTMRCLRDKEATRSTTTTTSSTPKPTSTNKSGAGFALRVPAGGWAVVLGFLVGGLAMAF